MDHYYVRMAVAWAVSVILYIFRKRHISNLRENRLDDWTYNKALQKNRYTYRSPETKGQIRAMKRKKSGNHMDGRGQI